MYLLFNAGGTNMKVAISEDGTTILKTQIVPSPANFEEGMEKIKQIAQELEVKNLTGIAGGIAGSLDKGKTMLMASPHLGGWAQKPLKEGLEKTFNCPAVLENDAVLEGLGEAREGAGKKYSIVAFITIGTGVGGVRIVNGNIDNNSLGFEPGHQIIVPNGKKCNCGGKGHLETYVGGSYLKKIYHQNPEQLKDENVWDEVAKYLAIGLNNTIVHCSPDVVVLGGSVTASLSLEKINIYLRKELKIFSALPEIVLAKLGKDAGLYGALGLLADSSA